MIYTFVISGRVPVVECDLLKTCTSVKVMCVIANFF